MAAAGIYDIAISQGEHLVKFYNDENDLVAAVVPYLETGLPDSGECDTQAQPPRTELTVSFPAERESPGRARRLVGCELRRWGHAEGLVDDATLVVSELASNAVIHAGSPFTVSVQSRGSLLRIAVRDTASVLAGANGNRGLLVRTSHGLAVVQALATQWGVEGSVDGAGKIVWAELRIF